VGSNIISKMFKYKPKKMKRVFTKKEDVYFVNLQEVLRLLSVFWDVPCHFIEID
jgi:membrane protease subunit (stomatin/prohibitin family)